MVKIARPLLPLGSICEFALCTPPFHNLNQAHFSNFFPLFSFYMKNLSFYKLVLCVSKRYHENFKKMHPTYTTMFGSSPGYIFSPCLKGSALHYQMYLRCTYPVPQWVRRKNGNGSAIMKLHLISPHCIRFNQLASVN